MQHKTTELVWSYFNRIRNGASAPLRADIEPSALKTALPDVFLLEMAQDGAVRFRLAGTRVCSIMGRELRGEDFNLLWCRTDRHKMKLACEAVLVNRLPLMVASHAIGDDDAARERHCDMLLLPLFSRPHVCDRLFGSLVEVRSDGLRSEQFSLLKADRLEFLACAGENRKKAAGDDVAATTVAAPQFALGFAIPFFFIPTTSLALSSVLPHEVPAAAGLQNFLRTTSGAFATSIITTVWENTANGKRSLLAGGLVAPDRTIDALTAQGLTHDQALRQLEGMVQTQAVMLSTNQVFQATAAIFALAATIIWLAPRPKRMAAAGGH